MIIVLWFDMKYFVYNKLIYTYSLQLNCIAYVCFGFNYLFLHLFITFMTFCYHFDVCLIRFFCGCVRLHILFIFSPYTRQLIGLQVPNYSLNRREEKKNTERETIICVCVYSAMKWNRTMKSIIFNVFWKNEKKKNIWAHVFSGEKTEFTIYFHINFLIHILRRRSLLHQTTAAYLNRLFLFL